MLTKQVIADLNVYTSTIFDKCLLLVPKSNNKWWPILDFSIMNILRLRKFKMGTTGCQAHPGVGRMGNIAGFQ